MQIGIIYIDEKYQSLNAINKDMISALQKKYTISTYKYHVDIEEKDIKRIETLYKKVDCVISLSSKCINFTRKTVKPTLFIWHAWMDHGGWISMYHNNKFFHPSDAVSFASRAAVKKYEYLYNDRINWFLLPYFSSINPITTTTNELKQIKEKYNIPQDKKIIIYFGRLCQEKNIEGILEIYKGLHREDTCLLMVWNYSDQHTYGFWHTISKAKYQEKIESIIGKMNNKNIRIINGIERETLIKILGVSYIAINTSTCYEEDFWLSNIEAMKIWLPVICSDRGGLKEWVIHKKTGFLIKTQIKNNYTIESKYDTALKYINTILDNPNLYKRLSWNARKRAEELYWEATFINNIEKILTKITNKTHTKKKQLLIPKPQIKKIFDKALQTKRVNTIYTDSPDIYKKLYKFYVSK